MRKLFIVHSEPDSFYQLITVMRESVVHIHVFDYELFARRKVGKLINDTYISSSNEPKDIKFANKIIESVEKYNDAIYNDMLSWIGDKTGKKELVFIRLEDVRLINKLKRHIKRPNYTTVLLTREKIARVSTFDVIIYTIDELLFKVETRKFIKTQLRTFKFMNQSRLKS